MVDLFLFNVILNSFLIFFTTLFFVEGVVFLFRIQNERIKYFARLLPLMKVVMDCFRYDFSRWAFMDQINPLLCPEGSRTLTLAVAPFQTLIQFFVLDRWTFTLTDVIGTFIHPRVMQGIVWGVLAISLVKCVLFVRRYQVDLRNTISPYSFRGKIYFPEAIQFTEEEREAIIQHEKSHIFWKDYWIKPLCHLLAAIFWWIPLGWWLRRMELSQEKAADQCVKEKVHLLSAIYKVAKESRTLAVSAFTSQFTKRMESITKEYKKCGVVRTILLTLLLFVIGASRLWIF